MGHKLSDESCRPIRYLHISHNAPYLPPKIVQKHCFQFLLGRLLHPGEMKNKGYAKFYGAKKVHYRKCGSGVRINRFSLKKRLINSASSYFK